LADDLIQFIAASTRRVMWPEEFDAVRARYEKARR